MRLQTVACASFTPGITPQVVEHRSGGDPSTSHKSPGRNKFDAVILERGLTHDPDFQQWLGTAGQENRLHPRPHKFDNIDLKRGYVEEPGFAQWANDLLKHRTAHLR